MSFQSDAVTQSMGEGAVVGSVAGVGDDFARDGVDIAALLSRCGERQRFRLRLAQNVKYLLRFG